MEWFYVKDGKQAGPVAEKDFKRLADQGEINDQTLVWHAGMEEWVPYGRVADGGPLKGEGMGRCKQCGRELPLSDLVQYQGVSICGECKPAFFQRVKEGAELPGVLVYAGFWIRFCAKFIDGFILYVINTAIGLIGGIVLASAATKGDVAAMSAGVQGVLSLVQILVQMSYYVFFHGKYGATPGKMACKIKVVRPDGSRITYGRAVGRYFAEWLSTLILCIGYIMAAFNAEKRALHDQICDTRVIRKGQAS